MATNGSNGVHNYQTKLFINNEYVDAKHSEKLTVYNPADDSLVTDSVQVAGPADIDAAVDAASAAFKGSWRRTSPADRAKIMLKFADLLEAKAADFGRFETMCMGQPAAVAGAIGHWAVAAFRYYAGWTDKFHGEQHPADDGMYKLVHYEPIGVCAGIGAWNASLYLWAGKVAPAVATGCTIVYKASEKSPLGVLALGELVKEAGFPPGVINIVSGGGETGHLLASHMRISKISFTGSAFAGKKVAEAGTKSNLKRVTLELGGKSPALVFDDADIENALEHASNGFLANSGQICVAASRTYVQEDIAPKFIEALKARFEGAKKAIGNPSEPTTMLGPLADKQQLDRVLEFLESGKKEATLVTGGNRIGNTGAFIEPTIFTNPKDDARIYKEEIFGPVATIKTFKTEEEAIELANNTSYGLSSAIYTSSMSRALRVSTLLESGTVAVNSTMIPSIRVPFGGWKQSGLGSESGKAGLMSYLATKTITINMAV